MVHGDDEALVGQVIEFAGYDAAREVANQLVGALVTRERDARSPDDAASWRAEQRKVRGRLEEIKPGTPEVGAALADWSARLAELRGATR